MRKIRIQVTNDLPLDAEQRMDIFPFWKRNSVEGNSYPSNHCLYFGINMLMRKLAMTYAHLEA